MASLSPTPILNQRLQPTTTSSSSDRARRKRKKKHPPPSSSQPSVSPSPSRTSLQRWRSEKQQQIYSTKLVEALRQLRISQPADPVLSSTPRGGRAVREAADGALAVAARGRTLWSRAMLANRSVKLKFRKQKRRRISSPVTASTGVETGNARSRKQRRSILRLKAKSLPAVQRKVKVLGRLVPGCSKQSLPVILEETADYIAAKQMQIRAMTAILSAVSPSAAPLPPSPSPAPPPPPSPSPPPPAHNGEQTHMLG